MNYLSFDRVGTGDVYAVNTLEGVTLGFIQKIRNGRFLHWSLVIPAILFEEDDSAIIFSPGCQDEIRDFCKRMNGKRSVNEACAKEEGEK